MAKKIGVLDVHQVASGSPQTYVRKNAAHLLVRRLLAVWVIENVLIQRVAIHDSAHIPSVKPENKPYVRHSYEHHIEPRLEHFGVADTQWLAYLNGYEVPGA